MSHERPQPKPEVLSAECPVDLVAAVDHVAASMDQYKPNRSQAVRELLRLGYPLWVQRNHVQPMVKPPSLDVTSRSVDEGDIVGQHQGSVKA